MVPSCFDRCVRVHHALEEGRWSRTAPQFLVRGVENYEYPYSSELQSAEGDMGEEVVDRLLGHLVRWSGDDGASHYGLWDGWGEFSAGTSTTVYSTGARNFFGALVDQALRRSPAPAQECSGCAFLDSCPVIEWYRHMRLFDGPLTAVAEIGSTRPGEDRLWRRSPQWWWPADRSWFVANEIDWPWSYLAGPDALIDSVLEDPMLETVEVQFTDRW